MSLSCEELFLVARHVHMPLAHHIRAEHMWSMCMWSLLCCLAAFHCDHHTVLVNTARTRKLVYFMIAANEGLKHSFDMQETMA